MGNSQPDANQFLSLRRIRKGGRRVVVLSAVTVADGGGHQRFADAFRAVEDGARASGLQWTILRCADFAVNALAWAPQIRQVGVMRGVYVAAVQESCPKSGSSTLFLCDGHRWWSS